MGVKGFTKHKDLHRILFSFLFFSFLFLGYLENNIMGNKRKIKLLGVLENGMPTEVDIPICKMPHKLRKKNYTLCNVLSNYTRKLGVKRAFFGLFMALSPTPFPSLFPSSLLFPGRRCAGVSPFFVATVIT
jgi:hypothetical protein